MKVYLVYRDCGDYEEHPLEGIYLTKELALKVSNKLDEAYRKTIEKKFNSMPYWKDKYYFVEHEVKEQ